MTYVVGYMEVCMKLGFLAASWKKTPQCCVQLQTDLWKLPFLVCTLISEICLSIPSLISLELQEIAWSNKFSNPGCSRVEFRMTKFHYIFQCVSTWCVAGQLTFMRKQNQFNGQVIRHTTSMLYDVWRYGNYCIVRRQDEPMSLLKTPYVWIVRCIIHHWYSVIWIRHSEDQYCE